MNYSDCPAPLTPPDCDLSSLDWFPFRFRRLRRSDFWLRASAEVRAISIELWCEAYQEVPAASLPDNDAALAQAAGFGRFDLDRWRAIKADVMSAWTLCSDGRWYHRYLSEVALEAFLRRLGERSRKGGKAGAAAAERIAAVEEMLARARNSAEEPASSGGNSKSSGGRSETSGGKTPSSGVTRQDRTVQDRNTDVAPVDRGGAGGSAPPVGGRQTDVIPVNDVPRETSPPSRATLLPDDWNLSDKLRDIARAEGLTEFETDRQASIFKDYWRAKGGKEARKRDWDATWRNWVRRAADDKRRRGGGASAGVVDDIRQLRDQAALFDDRRGKPVSGHGR